MKACSIYRTACRNCKEGRADLKPGRSGAGSLAGPSLSPAICAGPIHWRSVKCACGWSAMTTTRLCAAASLLRHEPAWKSGNSLAASRSRARPAVRPAWLTPQSTAPQRWRRRRRVKHQQWQLGGDDINFVRVRGGDAIIATFLLLRSLQHRTLGAPPAWRWPPRAIATPVADSSGGQGLEAAMRPAVKNF